MSSSNLPKTSTTMLEHLPTEFCWNWEFRQWEGFWIPQLFLAPSIAAKSQFKACDGDVILASPVKAGSTWLKALIPCILNQKPPSDDHDNIVEEDDYDPLVECHPNSLMPFLEFQASNEDPCNNVDISARHSAETTFPRKFRTHAPYSLLSESIKKSNCKIVYIARNPKDVFVSLWHFTNARTPQEPSPLDEAFEWFCKGVHPFGPYHDHVLGYWKESLKNPEKILFLKYEEMKEDPRGQVKKLASFLGRPIVKDEDLDKILWKCSLERLKNLEVNKNGVDPTTEIPYQAYFWRGVVGNWKNYLSKEMQEKLDKISKIKFEESGLHF